MSKPRMLTGYELVEKGLNKNDVTLPEIGYKDITTNGSWLEQKQIQSALEARKHLVEAERIEKVGSISHAEWCDDLKLAKVVRKVGGHWQHIGHNIGKQLYLNPEETLYLMETNSLLLKHNDIVVSLQKAYALLIDSDISLNQYKVYASLSRLGYRIRRHREDAVYVNKTKKKNKSECSDKKQASQQQKLSDIEMDTENNVSIEDSQMSEDVCELNENESTATFSVDELGVVRILKHVAEQKIVKTKDKKKKPIKNLIVNNYQIKINKLQNRKQKQLDPKITNEIFSNIPDIYRKQVITLNNPNEKYLPRNVFLHKASYTLNIDNLRSRNTTVSPALSTASEVSPNVRRIRGSIDIETRGTVPPQYTGYPLFPCYLRYQHFRPTYWRPHMNYYHNIYYQRPFIPPYFLQQKFRFQPQPYIRPNPTSNNTRGSRRNKRKHNQNHSTKLYHLQVIKSLVSRLRQISNIPNSVNTSAIIRLINVFNNKYNESLRLTPDLDIVGVDEEVIELEDDDETTAKKPRLSETELFDTHLNNLKVMASRLKDLDVKNLSSSRHRRALSTLIKTFNKSFHTDVYLNDYYEIIDRKLVNLDSSDSDVSVKEVPTKRKKLRNPFNILKRLSEKSTTDNVSTNVHDSALNESVMKHFDKKWLPNDNDFGKPEICLNSVTKTRLLESQEDCMIYDYIKHEGNNFNDWIDLKISFVNHIEATALVSQIDLLNKDFTDIDKIKPIIGPEDCTNTESVLNKLRIIKTFNDFSDISLTVHFDVYNRNVRDFKKTKPPKPHFRIICLDEKSPIPDGAEIAALSLKYKDNVPIVFAIVGIGSISYLQMKSTDLPVYIPNRDIA